MIKNHYQAVAKINAGKTVSKRFWAGTEEILAAVMILRERLIIWDVDTTGLVHTQLCYID